MGYRLHVQRWGAEGPPILLIHGIGASWRYWRSTAELLQQDFRALAPDLLGFGRSPWPKIGYTVDDHIDALETTLKTEGMETEALVVAGHSLGAIRALAWVARQPRRCSGLALLGLPRYRSSEEARGHVAGLGPLAYATVARPRVGAAVCALMCFGRPFWRLVAPVLMPDLPADVARDGVLHIWESYSRTLNHAILEVNVGILAQQVATSGLPVRLLHGDLDREAPLAGVADLGRSTGWRLQVLMGASHALPLERPDACVEVIRELAGSL